MRDSNPLLEGGDAYRNNRPTTDCPYLDDESRTLWLTGHADAYHARRFEVDLSWELARRKYGPRPDPVAMNLNVHVRFKRFAILRARLSFWRVSLAVIDGLGMEEAFARVDAIVARLASRVVVTYSRDEA